MPSWSNYSRYYRETEPIRQQQEKLLQFLHGLEFESVLEIGCSFGRVTKLIDEEFHPKRFLAVDMAPDVRRYTNVDFIQTDAMMLPETEKFDLVIAVEVLMHIKNYKPLLEKMKRLSKRHVVHLDYYEKVPTWPLDDGNYSHEFSDANKTMISQNQAIYHYEVTDSNPIPKGHRGVPVGNLADPPR